MNGFTGVDSAQAVEERISNSSQTLPKIEKEETFPNSF